MTELRVDQVEENTSIFGQSSHSGCHTLTLTSSLIILIKLTGCLTGLTGRQRMVVRPGPALVKGSVHHISEAVTHTESSKAFLVISITMIINKRVEDYNRNSF